LEVCWSLTLGFVKGILLEKRNSFFSLFLVVNSGIFFFLFLSLYFFLLLGALRERNKEKEIKRLGALHLGEMDYRFHAAHLDRGLTIHEAVPGGFNRAGEGL